MCVIIFFCGRLADVFQLHWHISSIIKSVILSLKASSSHGLIFFGPCQRPFFQHVEVEVEVKLRPTVGQSVFVSGSHLEPITRFFSDLQLLVFLCGASSLTRGWVCNLLVQLLLGLARAVTLGFKSCRTQRPYFTVSLETPRPAPPYLAGQIHEFISPSHWVPFLSPLTTRRAMVEVF
jgi:hypothetical protein